MYKTIFMNKVIAALDGLKLSESTTDYAVYLAEEFDAHIVAAFFEDITYHARPDTNDDEFILTDGSQMDVVTKKEEQVRVNSITKLQKKFDVAGVHYNIHRNKILALKSLIEESQYADMILIDGNEEFSSLDYSKPSRFLKNVLADAHCPVMIVQTDCKPVERFVFAYDGSPSSVYAIKQFSYLFKGGQKQEVEILMITDEKNTNHIPNHHSLKEMLRGKYATVLQSTIKSSNTEDAFVNHMRTENKNCMLVLGAYQRSSFSRWLYQSIADLLILELDIPLFIAHK
jgi:hypothetical protein